MFDAYGVIKLQEGYANIIKSGDLSKKAICDLVIPFRDRHGLSDLHALMVARKELSLKDLVEMLDGGKNTKEMSEKDITTPIERGWYLCRYVSCSTTHYDEETGKQLYRDCECIAALLYWDGDMWLVRPDSYTVIDNNKVLGWQYVPEGYQIFQEKVKVIS